MVLKFLESCLCRCLFTRKKSRLSVLEKIILIGGGGKITSLILMEDKEGDQIQFPQLCLTNLPQKSPEIKASQSLYQIKYFYSCELKEKHKIQCDWSLWHEILCICTATFTRGRRISRNPPTPLHSAKLGHRHRRPKRHGDNCFPGKQLLLVYR